jgi:adenylylsulfate kinase
MTIKILVMGLPGSGKTTFASALKTYIEDANMGIEGAQYSVSWFNADEVRKRFNDWDFSHDGRIRQSLRMAEFALKSMSDYTIVDFVAPLPEMRKNFGAHYTVWMDTIPSGRFEDTNSAFVAPDDYQFRIKEFASARLAAEVGKKIICDENWSEP